MRRQVRRGAKDDTDTRTEDHFDDTLEGDNEFLYDDMITVEDGENVPTPPDTPRQHIVIRKRSQVVKPPDLPQGDDDDDAEEEEEEEDDEEEDEGEITDDSQVEEKNLSPTTDRFIQERRTSAQPNNKQQPNQITRMVSRRPGSDSRAGPSGLGGEGRPKSGARTRPVAATAAPSGPADPARSSDSETDSEEVMMMMAGGARGGPLPGEYNPEEFRDLPVTEEIRELFQYITKYAPQQLGLDYKFKPFVPDYIPAVGDIDAFLKVTAPSIGPPAPPTGSPTRSPVSPGLGLSVLDEPAADQSDSALLHLQLRAVTVTTDRDTTKHMIVKRLENVEKSSKTVERWIKDISDLHRSKPPLVVKYSEAMPDLDSLMQEWAGDVEMLLRKDGFPSHRLRCSLTEYVDLICAMFSVPVHSRRIESLHLLFSLFSAIKSSQLYQTSQAPVATQAFDTAPSVTDHLILD